MWLLHQFQQYQAKPFKAGPLCRCNVQVHCTHAACRCLPTPPAIGLLACPKPSIHTTLLVAHLGLLLAIPCHEGMQAVGGLILLVVAGLLALQQLCKPDRREGGVCVCVCVCMCACVCACVTQVTSPASDECSRALKNL